MATARTTASIAELLQECRATDRHRRSAARSLPLFAIEAAQRGDAFLAIMGKSPLALTYSASSDDCGSTGIVAETVKQGCTSSVARLQEIALEAASQGITIADSTQPGNPIVYANAGFLRLTGYELEEVVGRDCALFVGCDNNAVFRALICDAIQNGQSRTLVICNRRKDGTTFWDEMSISPRYDAEGKLSNVVSVHNDVTERQLLVEQHRQPHRMEAIGQLANGIAHDVNNLLTVIMAHSEVLAHSDAFDSSVHYNLAQISMAGEQAAMLTRQLQSFNDCRATSKVLIDLNTVVGNMEEILRRVLDNEAQVSTVLQPGLHRVMGNPGQLSQILLNLAVHACNATPGSGQLVFTTNNVQMRSDCVGLHAATVPSEYVMISATYTSAGVTREASLRDYESDFVTKLPHVDTASSLFDLQIAVIESKGCIDVEVEVGIGTTIKVYLPSAEATATTKGIP